MSAGLAFDESSPWVVFFHCVLTWPFLGASAEGEGKGERKRDVSPGVSSYKDTNPIRSEHHPYYLI